jgi:NAD(P)-dependent dehydrogenase (short-subunit alcohol dehydrogenase family)
MQTPSDSPRAARVYVQLKTFQQMGRSSNQLVGPPASKAVVIQLTRISALELGQHGINANCAAPSAVDTEMLRGGLTEHKYAELIEGRKKISSLGAVRKPEDVPNAVPFFASDDSRFRGKTLLVYGGTRDFV